VSATESVRRKFCGRRGNRHYSESASWFMRVDTRIIRAYSCFYLDGTRLRHRERLATRIGSAYRSQTHKVFQRLCQLVSGVGMQISNFRSRRQNGQLFRQVVKKVSIGHVVDHFQRELLNLELFGPGCGAIVISCLFLLISLSHQGGHSGVEKGVI
jgi:hypothetical protein